MNHRPRKRFGQNFLHYQGVIERIFSCVNPQPGQHLVEIGPGQGALTRGLLREFGELGAVELNRDLLDPLGRLCAPLGMLHLRNDDQRPRLVGFSVFLALTFGQRRKTPRNNLQCLLDPSVCHHAHAS